MHDNKRRHSRIDVKGEFKATLYLVEDAPAVKNTPATTGIVKDYSKSGIGIFTVQPIALHKIVRIVIEQMKMGGDGKALKPHSLGPALEGRVVWSTKAKPEEKAPDTHPYRLGIDFMPRDDAAQEWMLKLYKLIQELEQTS